MDGFQGSRCVCACVCVCLSMHMIVWRLHDLRKACMRTSMCLLHFSMVMSLLLTWPASRCSLLATSRRQGCWGTMDGSYLDTPTGEGRGAHLRWSLLQYAHSPLLTHA